MLSVEEALNLVLGRAQARQPATCPLSEALGTVLAEDITSDVDSPPHDKSLVDGYAVVAADLAGGSAELDFLEEITAGDVPRHAVTPGVTSRVMTGAPIPEGADAVVMVEQSQWLGGPGAGRVRLEMTGLASGRNIMRRAASIAHGDRVLTAGHQLRAIEIGILAEVGRVHVEAIPMPRVAVLSTGNELVPPPIVPGPGHIRNSNGPMLVAAAAQAGAVGYELGIARDEPAVLRERMSEGLQFDVLVISGGVSAGVLDLVPGVLAELGVEQVFHKIRLKPGKPLWFGVQQADGGDKLVFGLPGNPVSSLICFELFVRPAIARLAGRAGGMLTETQARLATARPHRGQRPSYHPARLYWDDGQAVVEPLRWQGSGDLTAVAQANALACFPAGDRTHEAGEMIRVLKLFSSG